MIAVKPPSQGFYVTIGLAILLVLAVAAWVTEDAQAQREQPTLYHVLTMYDAQRTHNIYWFEQGTVECYVSTSHTGNGISCLRKESK